MDGRTDGRTTRKHIASAGAYRRRRLKNVKLFVQAAMTYSADSDADRSYLHLTGLQRIMITGPRVPLHAVSVRAVSTTKVEAVQVGRMTRAVPPGALV